MLKVAYHPIFEYKTSKKHRFPMQKYPLLVEKLLAEGIFLADNFFTPQKLSETEILTTHQLDYWTHLKHQTLPTQQIRAIGFDMTPELVERERYIAHASYECALFAKQFGVSLTIAGGTHHAFADHGEGFCIFNDFAVASHLLLQREQASKILIVDLDVHQGNGTAKIFENNPQVFTFSMHGAKNFPFRKQQSDLDIELANDTGDLEYLTILRQTLPKLIYDFRPDMLLYQAGVDVLATDKLGKLALTLEGCQARDKFVFECAKYHQIPIAVSMGGGYSENITDIVQAHYNTFQMVHLLFS